MGSQGASLKRSGKQGSASELRFDGGDHRRLPHILEHLASDPAIAQKLVGQFGTIGAVLALPVAGGSAFEEIRPAKCLVVDVRAEFDAVIADGAAQQIEEVAVVGLVQVGYGAAKHFARHHIAADNFEEACDALVAAHIFGPDPVRFENLPGIAADDVAASEREGVALVALFVGFMGDQVHVELAGRGICSSTPRLP